MTTLHCNSDTISTASPNNVILECQLANEKMGIHTSNHTLMKAPCDEGYTSDNTEVTSNTKTVETRTKQRSPLSISNRTCDADGCFNAVAKCCSRCHSVYYCGAACQKAHWKFHKPSCIHASKCMQEHASSKSKKRSQRQLPQSEKSAPKNVLSFTQPVKIPQEPAADEQSIGLRSKPSIIKVANDVEEDFERFQEVDDDDKLSCSSRHTTTSAATASSRATAAQAPFLPFVALTEERVRAHVRDYYEDFDSIFRLGKSSKAAWDSFFEQYFTPDIQWVRSSSNSLTGPELAEHFANDIVGIRMKLVEINSIQILAGTSAVVTFMAHQKYEYRGNSNSDRTKVTMVLVVGGNGREIRIAHEHRCTGMAVPEDYNWD